MRFNNFFIPIGMMALHQAIPLVMADDCKIESAAPFGVKGYSGAKGYGDVPVTFGSEDYDIPINYCFYHDYDIVDVRVEIPGAGAEPDHLEVPVRVRANASPIHFDETYELDIYFKNDWTFAHNWEAKIPVIGPTLDVDLQTRINRENCKLGLRLHMTGTGILGALDEIVNLGELDQDGIKFLAKSLKLC